MQSVFSKNFSYKTIFCSLYVLVKADIHWVKNVLVEECSIDLFLIMKKNYFSQIQSLFHQICKCNELLLASFASVQFFPNNF